MSIPLEFYNLIIRRDRLEAILPGGWDQFLAEYEIGGRVWHDEDLLRDGAMDPMSLNMIIDHWEERGLKLTTTRKGRKSYADMFPTGAFSGSTPIPCDWIEIVDGETARFIGERDKPRKRRLKTQWSEPLVELTRASILDVLKTWPRTGITIPVKNFDDRFGLLHVESGSRRSLVITDRETEAIEAYRQIDDLLAAGWALD